MENEIMGFQQNKEIQETTNAMMVGRQAQEVQAAMIIAKRFPRDELIAYNRIMKTCKRKGLAEQAEYTYPRGGKKVIGASIRLAEAVAKNWGNIDYGIIELSQEKGKSEMMAYAWDLETNTRATRIFHVEHKRDTKQGGYALTDSRDIYEITANMGSRRVRACILQIVPGDILEDAIKQCRETLKGSYKEPLADRIRNLLGFFQDEYTVTKEQLEKYIGYSLESFNENDFLKLNGVHRSLKEGMGKREDYFEFEKVEKETAFEKAVTENHEKTDDLLKKNKILDELIELGKLKKIDIDKIAKEKYNKLIMELIYGEIEEIKKVVAAQ